MHLAIHTVDFTINTIITIALLYNSKKIILIGGNNSYVQKLSSLHIEVECVKTIDEVFEDCIIIDKYSKLAGLD